MPSVVFMDIGTYDLVAADCDPAELAREIVSTAMDFSLVISEILRRKDKRRLDFNNDVDELRDPPTGCRAPERAHVQASRAHVQLGTISQRRWFVFDTSRNE